MTLSTAAPAQAQVRAGLSVRAVAAGVLGLTTANGARLALFRGFLVGMPKERV